MNSQKQNFPNYKQKLESIKSKDPSFIPLDATEGFNLVLWDEKTDAERDIDLALLNFFRDWKYEIKDDISPELKTLAKMAKWSLGTVKKYVLKDYFNLIATKICRTNSKTGKNTSNQYIPNINYFNFLEKLNDLGYAKNYKNHRQWLREKVMNNEGFLREKWREKHGLSTTRVATANPEKVAAIKTSSYKDKLEDKSTKTESAAKGLLMNANAVLGDIPLSYSTRTWIDKNCCYNAAQAAKLDYDWYRECGPKPIDSIDGFIIKQVKYNTEKLFGFRRGKSDSFRKKQI